MIKTVYLNQNMPSIDISIPDSKWNNPFGIDKSPKFRVISDYEALEMYYEWLLWQPHLVNSLPELRDKILICSYNNDSNHSKVLLELLDNYPEFIDVKHISSCNLSIVDNGVCVNDRCARRKFCRWSRELEPCFKQE